MYHPTAITLFFKILYTRYILGLPKSCGVGQGRIQHFSWRGYRNRLFETTPYQTLDTPFQNKKELKKVSLCQCKRKRDLSFLYILATVSMCRSLFVNLAAAQNGLWIVAHHGRCMIVLLIQLNPLMHHTHHWSFRSWILLFSMMKTIVCAWTAIVQNKSSVLGVRRNPRRWVHPAQCDLNCPMRQFAGLQILSLRFIASLKNTD